ncbi:MAG: hypothetical protein ACK4OP_16295 [Gemmobacter sp.]
MRKHASLGLSLVVVTALAGCLQPYPGVGPNGELPVIAVANDSGFDSSSIKQQQAAIAYDPDGCQNWLIDDGVEGYASRRRDPRSGLPVCNNQFPPGTVVKEYRQGPFQDWVPARQARVVQ